MFKVNADHFRAVALFQSTEQVRYYLAGVHIEAHPAGGVLLVATDGSRLLVVHDEAGECDAGPNGYGYIVSLDKAALAACKVERGEIEPRKVTGAAIDAPGWITDAAGEQLAMVKGWYIDGTFPDWRRVLPSGEHDAEPHWFDPNLFASFAAASKILSGDSRKAKPIRIEAGSEGGGPSLVRFFDLAYAFGVIMPMRGDGLPAGKPEFLNRRPQAVAAE